MGIEYTIKKYTDNNGDDITIVLPEKYSVVKSFLHDAIHDLETGKRILERINMVLNGQSEYEEDGGEWFSIRIKKDNSTAVDTIAEDKGEKHESYIDTMDLKELVEIWTKAISEFNLGKKTS